MTEFGALRWAASAIFLVALIGFLVTWQAIRGFGQILANQSWLLVGAPLHLMYLLVGYLAGLGTRALLLGMFIPYILADLWVPPLAVMMLGWWADLSRYRDLRTYAARH